MTHLQRIMVVDDQFLLALDVADVVEDNGHLVQGPFSTVDRALAQLETEVPDCALLDINMGQGTTTEPIAKELMARNVPFAFITGYTAADVLSSRFSHIERLGKPAVARDIGKLLKRLLPGSEAA